MRQSKLIIYFSITIFILSGCKPDGASALSENAATAVPSETLAIPEATETTEKVYESAAAIEDIKLIGYSAAIVCGIIEDSLVEEQGFALYDEKGNLVQQIEGIPFEEKYYAKIDGLEDGSKYKLKMFGTLDNELVFSSDYSEIKTPAVILDKNQVEALLDEQIDYSLPAWQEEPDEITEEQMTIRRTQQLLSLIGQPYGDKDRFSLELQLNQLRLEYSFNSYGRFAFWNNVDGNPDEATNGYIMEILQTKEEYTQDDFVFPFVPAPHALVEYNLYNENGGQMDAERYIYDKAKLNEEVYESYKEYPFIYETDEFKEKYPDLAEKKESGEYNGLQIEYNIAKNKVMFYQKNTVWMEETASPQDPTILIAEENQDFDAIVIVQAAVAYSYLYMELPQDRNLEELSIQCGYRTCDVQQTLYSKKTSFAEVAKLSGAWHYDRQVQSYVPGFSNHQFGIALDFCNIFAFRSYNLYPYFQENAERYGFYNYYVESWHWVYLGE